MDESVLHVCTLHRRAASTCPHATSSTLLRAAAPKKPIDKPSLLAFPNVHAVRAQKNLKIANVDAPLTGIDLDNHQYLRTHDGC